MLAVNSLQTTDTSTVHICTECGISHITVLLALLSDWEVEGIVHKAAKLSVHTLESLGTIPAVFVTTETCRAILSWTVMHS